jgi:hypothetical protein
MNGAAATVVLHQRKISPASETKPGKPPKVGSFRGVFFEKEEI